MISVDTMHAQRLVTFIRTPPPPLTHTAIIRIPQSTKYIYLCCDSNSPTDFGIRHPDPLKDLINLFGVKFTGAQNMTMTSNTCN